MSTQVQGSARLRYALCFTTDADGTISVSGEWRDVFAFASARGMHICQLHLSPEGRAQLAETAEPDDREILAAHGVFCGAAVVTDHALEAPSIRAVVSPTFKPAQYSA